MLRVSGRVFKLSCSRAFLRLHILVIPHSNLVANEDDTFIGNRGGGFIRVVIRVVLSFIWISCLGKTLKERGVFLFSWFTTFHFTYKVTCEKSVFLPLLSSGANLALTRIANEDTGNRGEVFVCVIRVVYRTPGYSVSKRISKNEACSCFLLWPPSISQVCGSL